MPPKRKRARKTDKENRPQTGGRGTEEEWLERPDHPLLNDVVLKTLFQYVKPHELMACRSVCKKWNKASLPLARSMLSVTIFGENSSSVSGRVLTDYIDRDSYGIANLKADTHRVNNFVELFGSNKCLGIPFTNYNLGSFNPTVGAGKKFFELCGDKIKRIDLNRTREIHLVENVGEFLRMARKLEYFKMPHILQSRNGGSFNSFSDPRVPTLKCLKTLDMGQDIFLASKRQCSTFLEEFLTAAENISTIIACKSSSWDTNVGLKVFKILEEIGRLSQIETLSFPIIEDEDLIALQKIPGLKLKHVRARLGRYGGTRSFEFVELMKDNLISIQLHIDEDDSILDYFPRMPKLKLMDLVLEAADECVLNNFSDSFPALQYLKIDSEDGGIMSDRFLTGSECCPIMKSLNLGNFKVKLQIFKRTLDVFPNLKELELTVTVDGEDILQKIWIHMPQLEKLNIYVRLPPRCGVESLITGISYEEFIKIEEKLKLNTLKDKTREARRQMILEQIHEHKTLPSIGNLTNLRHLTLNIMARPGRKPLPRSSELAGYFGIYALMNLRHLNITDCKFSKTCSQILVADMELDSWNFQRPGNTHIIPSRWNSESDGGDWSFPSSKVLI